MWDAADLLEELHQSDVFSNDFPRRPQLTHAEASHMSEDEAHLLHGPAMEAINRVHDTQRLVGLARGLGKAKYERAIPTLAELWRTCALEPLRTAAGHALREIATPEAWQALVAMIDDADHLSVYLAIRAIFDQAPMQAYERLDYRSITAAQLGTILADRRQCGPDLGLQSRCLAARAYPG